MDPSGTLGEEGEKRQSHELTGSGKRKHQLDAEKKEEAQKTAVGKKKNFKPSLGQKGGRGVRKFDFCRLTEIEQKKGLE